jgi:hypothetical protein
MIAGPMPDGAIGARVRWPTPAGGWPFPAFLVILSRPGVEKPKRIAVC